ncbi:MAG: hypothetical protein Q6K99_02105, partial [Thermostichales cyanobacterium BF4_bins_65]
MNEHNSRHVGRGWTPQIAAQFPRIQWPDGSLYPRDEILAGFVMGLDDPELENFRERHLKFFESCQDPDFRGATNQLVNIAAWVYTLTEKPIEIEVKFNSYSALGSAAFGEKTDRMDSMLKFTQLVVTDFFALLYRLIVIGDIHNRRRIYNLSKESLQAVLDRLKVEGENIHLMKNCQGEIY